jgi:hypothetical protein
MWRVQDQQRGRPSLLGPSAEMKLGLLVELKLKLKLSLRCRLVS